MKDLNNDNYSLLLRKAVKKQLNELKNRPFGSGMDVLRKVKTDLHRIIKGETETGFHLIGETILRSNELKNQFIKGFLFENENLNLIKVTEKGDGKYPFNL